MLPKAILFDLYSYFSDKMQSNEVLSVVFARFTGLPGHYEKVSLTSDFS